MLKKGQQLLDVHHVIRYVPWTKLRKDEDDLVLGFLPSAFELRENEEHLSVNWLEYFSGVKKDQIMGCINEFRCNISVKKKSAFGIASVGKIKSILQERGKSVRIVYSPSENNPSHASVTKLPRDELLIFETLATDAFSEMILNSELP